MGKKSRSGSGMDIPDHKQFFGLKILKFCGSGSGMEKFGSATHSDLVVSDNAM
jgi:hypothetical protein